MASQNQQDFENYIKQLQQLQLGSANQQFNNMGEQYAQGQNAYKNYNGILGEAGTRINNFASSPGYTPAEAQSMRLGATAPIEASFRSGANQVARTASITGNPAGLANAQLKFARERGMAVSGAEAGVAGKVADARREDSRYGTEAGLDYAKTAAGPAQMSFQNYGQVGGNLNAGLNTGTPMAQLQYQNAQRPNLWSKIAGAGKNLAGAFAGPITAGIGKKVSNVFGI